MRKNRELSHKQKRGACGRRVDFSQILAHFWLNKQRKAKIQLSLLNNK
jgi:hypothetical protein